MSIEAQQLSFRYRHARHWIFKNHNFRVATGQILAILGPNGRGKTTLLRCLQGTARPYAGRVVKEGETAHVPQSIEAIFPFSARDMVIMGRARRLGLFGTPGRKDRDAADAAITRLGIEALASRPFPSLSGGERQMVLIARALAADAETLIFDEPTSALDFKNQAIILETVRSLVAERGFSVVFSTHDPAHAVQIASHALLMLGPTAYRFGPSDEILTDPMLSELYSVPLRKLTFEHDDRPATTIVPVFRRGGFGRREAA